MSENPYRTTIILHGGPEPLDGTQVRISGAVASFGYYFVAVPPEPMSIYSDGYEYLTRREVATYQRRRVGEGEPGTCEARVWDEWHYVGSKVQVL